MALPPIFLQELKTRSDLVEIASSYVRLKRSGKGRMGLCPFHSEKTPSFHIYPENGSFYCFGCNVGGDVITFVMRIEHLDYINAVRFLAERAGLEMPQSGMDDKTARLRSRVLEINRATARFFHEMLRRPEGAAGAAYCKNRRLDFRTIRHFGLGFAPEGGFRLVNHLTEAGFQREEMIQANVVSVSKRGNLYDRFRSRLMFPIIDLRGNVVAFGGRILTDEKPKYINTSDTPVYHKGSGLYAMNFAKKDDSRQLILAEGYMDVIALHRAGFINTIASLGTALTEEQARIMARYADEVVICYDNDEAGQRATQRAIPILKKTGLFVKVVTVPGGKDPDEFMKSYGDQGPLRFKRLVQESGNDVEYQLNRIKPNFDLETADGKNKYLGEAVKIIMRIENLMQRDVFIGLLAEETGVRRDSIEDSVDRSIHHEMKKQQQQKAAFDRRPEDPTKGSAKGSEKRVQQKVANAEESVIVYLFRHPEDGEQIRQRIAPEQFLTAFHRRLYTLVLGKTKEQNLSATTFSGMLTPEEMTELVKMINVNRMVGDTWSDVEKNIEIILSGEGISDIGVLGIETDADIQAHLERLRKQKQGGWRNGSNTGS